MKKSFLEKFKSNVIDKAQVKKIIGGNQFEQGCGTVCTTLLDCASNEKCATCPAGIPGKGCERL